MLQLRENWLFGSTVSSTLILFLSKGFRAGQKHISFSQSFQNDNYALFVALSTTLDTKNETAILKMLTVFHGVMSRWQISSKYGIV